MAMPPEVTKGRSAVFLAKCFFPDKFRTTKAGDILRDPSFFSRRCASKHMHDDHEPSGQHWTSGQGHVMTQVGNAASQSMLRVEVNAIRSRSPL